MAVLRSFTFFRNCGIIETHIKNGTDTASTHLEKSGRIYVIDNEAGVGGIL